MVTPVLPRRVAPRSSAIEPSSMALPTFCGEGQKGRRRGDEAPSHRRIYCIALLRRLFVEIKLSKSTRRGELRLLKERIMDAVEAFRIREPRIRWSMKVSRRTALRGVGGRKCRVGGSSPRESSRPSRPSQRPEEAPNDDGGLDHVHGSGEIARMELSTSSCDCKPPLVGPGVVEKDGNGFVVLNDNYIYYKKNVLGSGSHGKVYEGWDASPDASTSDPPSVAIKKLRCRPQDLLRNKNEVDIMTKKRSIHGAQMLAAIITDKHYYLILKLLKGVVAPLIEAKKNLPPSQMKWERVSPLHFPRMAADLSAALVYDHERFIAHRDIKPENVLNGDDGSVALCDYSMSIMFDGGNPMIEFGGGTILFSAPEVGTTKYDPRCADIYSLGMTLAVMLTGVYPFFSIGNIYDEKPRLNGVSEEWANLIASTLEKDPAERPTARMLRKSIKALLNTLPLL